MDSAEQIDDAQQDGGDGRLERIVRLVASSGPPAAINGVSMASNVPAGTDYASRFPGQPHTARTGPFLVVAPTPDPLGVGVSRRLRLGAATTSQGLRACRAHITYASAISTEHPRTR